MSACAPVRVLTLLIAIGCVGSSVAPTSTPGGLDGAPYALPSIHEGPNETSNTSVLARVSVWTVTAGMVYDPSDGLVYVVNCNCSGYPSGQGSVSVISGGTVIATVPLPLGPGSPMYDPANGDVYVGSADCDHAPCGNAEVSLINGTQVIGTAPVSPYAHVIGYDPANGDMLVGNATDCAPKACTDGNLTFLSGSSVVAVISTGGLPGPVAYDPQTGILYVSDNTDTYLSAGLLEFSGTKLVGTVPVGGCPGDLVFDPENGYVYDTGVPACGDLAVPSQGNVTVVQGSSIVARVQVGIDSAASTLDPETGDIYVSNWATGNVSVVHGVQNVGTVTTGKYAYDVVYNPSNGLVYVTNDGANNVTLISGTSSMTSIPVGLYPSYEVYDPDDEDVYVASACQDAVCAHDNVSILGPMVASFTVSPSFVTVNGTVFLNVTTLGGTPPFSITFTGLPPGCASQNRSSLACSPTRTGTYSGLSATVRDADGLVVLCANLTLVVTLPPGPGGGSWLLTKGPGGVPWLAWPLLGAGLISAAVFVRLRARTRRSTPSEPRGEASPTPPHSPN